MLGDFYPRHGGFIPAILFAVFGVNNWGVPLASILVQIPAWIRGGRDECIATSVVSVPDPSVVFTQSHTSVWFLVLTVMNTGTGIVRSLNPSTAQAKIVGQKLLAAMLLIVWNDQYLIYYTLIINFSKMCHGQKVIEPEETNQ